MITLLINTSTLNTLHTFQWNKIRRHSPKNTTCRTHQAKKEEIHFIQTYIKSLVIVCEPLARALNSTPVKSTDVGCFHSISFPLKQLATLFRRVN